MQPSPVSGRHDLLSLVLVVFVAGLLALVHQLSSADRGRGVQVVAPGERTAPASAEEAAPEIAGTDALPRTPERVREGEAGDPPASTSFLVQGQIADARTGLPLARHRLVLAWHLTDDPPRRAEVETGDNGHFELELSSAHWKTERYYSAQILDPEGRELFRGLVLLQGEIALAVAPRPLLQGRLVTEPALDYAGVLLRVWTPPSQALETQLLCGETRLAADGGFALTIDEPVASEEILLVFSDKKGGFADATLPRRLVDEGIAATIERELIPIEVRLLDPQGTPLAGAALRIFPEGEAGAIRWSILSTSPEGQVQLQAQVGRYQLCAGQAGFRPVVDSFELVPGAPTQVLDYRLEPLQADDWVLGTVYSSSGSPVAGAQVSARPATRHSELARPATSETESDADGNFRLSASRDREWILRASHPEHGTVELEPFFPGDAPRSIVFQPLGSLSVQPAGAFVHATFSSGPMQYFLCEKGGTGLRSGYSNGCPWRIENVVAGEYDLYLMAHGQAAYAETSTSVVEKAETVVEAALDASTFLTGRILGPDGAPQAGLQVELVHPYWPSAVVRAWSSVTSGMDGSFYLFAGNLKQARVRVVRAGELLTEAEVALGTPATIQLP